MSNLQPAPHPIPPLADLVSNPTTPGHITREWTFQVCHNFQPRITVANPPESWTLEKLPPDATLTDAIYELEFRQAVEQGLAELDRGEGIPIEQVKAQIASWAGK